MAFGGGSFPRYDIANADPNDLPEALRQIQENFRDLALRTSGVSIGFLDTTDDVMMMAHFLGFIGMDGGCC